MGTPSDSSKAAKVGKENGTATPAGDLSSTDTREKREQVRAIPSELFECAFLPLSIVLI